MNDPRLTAYALGELTGQARADFERDLAASEDLQRALHETTQLAESLGQLPMPTDTLPEDQRNALRAECARNLKSKPRRVAIARILVLGGSLAAAAAVVIAVSLPAITGGRSKAGSKTVSINEALPVDQTGVASAAEEVSVSSETARLSTEGRSFVRSGRFDLAFKRFEQALQLDPYNIEARRGLESVTQSRPAYANNDADATQLHKLTQVDAKWESPVRRLWSQPTDMGMRISDQGASAASKEDHTSPSSASAPLNPSDQYAELTETISNEAKRLSSTKQEGLAVSGNRGHGGLAMQGVQGPVLTAPKSKAVTNFSSGWANSGSERGARSRDRRETENDKKSDAIGGSRSDFNTEAYDAIQENVFLAAKENPLSTFSIDVDTASYANVRRFLQHDQLPPAGAIRTEELINYFSYDYPQPEGDLPFSVNIEVSRAPWDASRELVRIGLQGRELPAAERGPANLVFLVDVSGSMNESDKLPLLKRSLQALVENLSARDRVAMVVYAGSSGLVLPSTPGTQKNHILEALENLQAGGSTNGASGIQLAYETARKNFLQEGNNRVILCTDGDFNVGTTNQSELVRLIERERDSGVFLSVLGFGTGNLKDSTMEKLADKGNGNYSYIDSLTEGRKVLVEQMGATLFTIAKDVKIQVEFNPAQVAGYRLIGYENRLLAKEDFNDDKKDAGEIGAGHSVTALYEIIPSGQPLPDRPSVDPLKYQRNGEEGRPSKVQGPNSKGEDPSLNPKSEIRNPQSSDLLTVKLRYKAPDGEKSQLIEVPLAASEIPAFASASPDFRFASAVAAFGMKLRGSPAAGDIRWSEIQSIVRGSLGEDPGSYRAEFLTLIERASRLAPAGHPPEE